MVGSRQCCADAWLARGWVCWSCTRDGNSGTEYNWRGPFGMRMLRLEPKPGREGCFNWIFVPEECECGEMLFEWDGWHYRSSCPSCHCWGILTVCGFLTDTFGPWSEVHKCIFACLFLPEFFNGTHVQSHNRSELFEAWLLWVYERFGREDRRTAKRCVPPQLLASSA
jgi:hypothetical protein